MNRVFWLDSKEYRVGVRARAGGELEVTVGGTVYRVLVESTGSDRLLLNIEGRVRNVVVASDSFTHNVYLNGRLFKVEKRSIPGLPRESRTSRGRREIKISMPGRVVSVLAAEGDEVREGQAVLVVEAMKMQNEMKAPSPGRLARVFFKAGEYVEAGAVLFVIE